MSLSPADDVLIRVERALDLDSTGQLVASVLSKKVAAGSTHVVIDIPVGPTAKGLFLLELGPVRQQHLQEVARPRGAMHGNAKALAHEDGQVAGVIEVRVTKDDGVQPAWNE